MGYNTVNVTSTPAVIVAANPKRKSVVIVNTSTSLKLYIGPDSSITTNNAIELATTGGSFFEDASGTGVYKGDIYGVCSGTIDCRYWERTE